MNVLMFSHHAHFCSMGKLRSDKSIFVIILKISLLVSNINIKRCAVLCKFCKLLSDQSIKFKKDKTELGNLMRDTEPSEC